MNWSGWWSRIRIILLIIKSSIGSSSIIISVPNCKNFQFISVKLVFNITSTIHSNLPVIALIVSVATFAVVPIKTTSWTVLTEVSIASAIGWTIYIMSGKAKIPNTDTKLNKFSCRVSNAFLRPN